MWLYYKITNWLGKFQNIAQLRAHKWLSIQKQYLYYLILQLLFILFLYEKGFPGSYLQKKL